MFDIVIYNGFHITMEGKGLGVIEEGGLAIQDGKIAAVGTAEEMRRADARRKIDASGMAVLPGLIDAHVHTGLRPAARPFSGHRLLDARGLWPFYDELDRKVRRSAPPCNS